MLRDNVPTVYLHTSHLQLDEPKCFSWLRRPEIFPVFFIHDLIPIEFPEFCSPGADGRHRIRVHTALTHARALIVNSKFTRGSLLNYTQEKALPIGVVPLANSIRENDQRYEPYQLGNEPFFLHVGTIEGRKNLGHLLNVWRHLIKKMGSARAPRLVILGSRGWECENVTATLDRSRELANHVIEVSSANDAELHYLMRQANGLITVSMTEGFGLPPVEAVQLGLPVIASDIPAHREVLGSGCEFVAPHDGEALANKIIALTTNKIDGQAHGAGLAPFGWDDHVQQALSFIDSVIAKSANSTSD
ncbi:glycosyltransferase family 4 protein (plasmid) [Ensifer adhaerens]